MRKYRLYIYNKNALLYNTILTVIDTILSKHYCFVIYYNDEKDIIECWFINIEERYETYKELQVNNIVCKLDPLSKLLEETEIKE
jgi:hypothetical protein